MGMFRKAVYYVTSSPAAVLPHCCANKPPLLETGASRPEKLGKVYRPSFLVYQVNGAADIHSRRFARVMAT